MAEGIHSGSSFPLGTTVAGDGVNFSLYSKSASKVELGFFDSVDSARPSRVISLDRERHRTYHYWHAFVQRIRPGQVYAYSGLCWRGPSAPAKCL
jgi:glycogen operon protein